MAQGTCRGECRAGRDGSSQVPGATRNKNVETKQLLEAPRRVLMKNLISFFAI
jgi:hypothetical protein